MASYKNPLLGKYGIRSSISKSMCFGICCDSKKECREELRSKVGYYDSLKYRFVVSEWYQNDLDEYQKYLKDREEEREYRRKDQEYRKECFKWVKENKKRLNEEWLTKFETKTYQNIKVKRSALEQWLLKPERLKEMEKENPNEI